MKPGLFLMLGIDKSIEEVEKIIEARHGYVLHYCHVKGWNPETLSMDQLMEIRSQPGFKKITKPKNSTCNICKLEFESADVIVDGKEFCQKCFDYFKANKL